MFAAHGYQRVKPPLLEFEDSLLAGSGAAVAEQTFRLMDPDSQRMMGLRADTTPQVARIATTRLASAPRPLRLSYAGQCLRVRGSQLAPDRQIAQAGIELIGHDSPEADAEIVLVAAEALAAIGLTRISFDLTLPTLVPALLDDAGMTGAGPGRAGARAGPQGRGRGRAPWRRAGAGADRIAACRRPGGSRAGGACARRACRPRRAHWRPGWPTTVAAIRARAPDLRLTVDPVEFRGFRYETGVSVTIFAPGRHEELGRGGRYICGDTEPATGMTLYPDAILRVAPPRAGSPAAVSFPFGTDQARGGRDCARLGYATVAALDADPTIRWRRRARLRMLAYPARRQRRRCFTDTAANGTDAWPMSR